jgi:non-ribosomal peptide synthetase-like protein
MDIVSAGAVAPAPATDPVLTGYAAVLAEVLQVDSVDPDAHVFEDLGADSMVMARFCARVRKREDLPTVSIKDVYQHPTIAGLATALAPAPATDPVQAGLAAVLAEVLQVDSVDPDAHVFEDLGADSMVMARFCARVRKREDLPKVSIKDVYQHPTIAGLAGALAPAPAADPVTSGLAGVLAEVLGVESVDPDAHVFEDLGADSMVMARFCARVRKREDLPTVSIKDVYAHPTVRSLAAALVHTPSSLPAPAGASTAAPAEVAHRAGTLDFVLTGALQAALFVGYSYLGTAVFLWCFTWIEAGGDLVTDYLRAIVAGGVAFLGVCLLPIAVKWTLIGRWRPQQIPIWSLGYVRFWLVKTLVVASPLVLFAGSPIYNFYLRALGAKVGRGAVILTRHAPVCADLVTIGDGTVIRKDTFLNGYRAHAGWIQIGPVTLGKNVFVGDKVALDIGASMGDGAQLGHASALHAGQAVPAGERWHGSPAQPTETNYQRVAPADCSTWRRARYATLQLLTLLLVYVPLGIGGIAILLVEVPQLATLMAQGTQGLGRAWFWEFALLLSLGIFFGSVLLRLLVMLTVPRLLHLLLQPDRVYRSFGLRYAAHRLMLRLTNSKFFHTATGDSSYVVPYVRSLGYRLGRPVVQTGSNFGNEVKHESPYLISVGRGTVVASGVAFLNAEYSSTSFKLSRTALGADNFLGNDIVYPPGGRTGDNCLLATKVLVPIDGEVREGVGLLGSPPFEIPRTVARDSEFARMAHGEDVHRRLAAKNRYNLRTIGWFVLERWFYTFVLTVVLLGAVDFLAALGPWALTAANVGILLFSLLYFSFVERASTGFRGVRPMYCSIYVKDFWRIERFFKSTARVGVHRLVNGTPFKPLLWRLVGVRVGKRLFDDGHMMAEKNIVTIGDDVTLNAGSNTQCHSQEDYAFKSDAATIGSGVTVGVAAFVHYGVVIGDGAVLEADSFLMKGEEVPAGARWGGNPARELQDGEYHVPFPAIPAPTRPGDHDTDDDARTGEDTQTVEEFMELFGKDGKAPAIPVQRKGGRHRANHRHLAGSR